MGRAGRGGQPSVCIFLHGKNQRLPKEMRPFFKGDRAVCLRKALTDIFRLSNVDGLLYILFSLVISLNSVEYETQKQKVDCSEACLMERRCVCSKCRYILITVGLRSDTFHNVLQLLLKLHCHLHNLSFGGEAGRQPGGQWHLGPGWGKVQVRLQGFNISSYILKSSDWLRRPCTTSSPHPGSQLELCRSPPTPKRCLC